MNATTEAISSGRSNRCRIELGPGVFKEVTFDIFLALVLTFRQLAYKLVHTFGSRLARQNGIRIARHYAEESAYQERRWY